MFVELVEVALLCLFPVLVITAGLFDVTSFTIPNWISIALVGLFVPAALAGHIGWHGFAMAFAVGAVALALAVFMFTISSNLVGCSIGISPGFSPLRILST